MLSTSRAWVWKSVVHSPSSDEESTMGLPLLTPELILDTCTGVLEDSLAVGETNVRLLKLYLLNWQNIQLKIQ